MNLNLPLPPRRRRDFPTPIPDPDEAPPALLLMDSSESADESAVTLASVLAVPNACIITMAQAYHPHMDIHYAEAAHDMVGRVCTNQSVLLVRPSSAPGNGPREIADAVRRLRQRGITRVYQPSDALIRFLGISDNRGGVVNALHRFEAGGLAGSWAAPVSQPTLDHHNGRSALRRK